VSGKPGRGARHKPAALRIVGGTHNSSRHGDVDAAKQSIASDRAETIPSPPRWLGSVARAEWRRVAPMLHKRGLMARRFVAALAGYCRAYGELVEAQRLIELEGRTVTTDKGNVIQHPAVGMANRAADQLRAYLVEFGLSPSAEGRLATGDAGAADPFDEFESEREEASGALVAGR